MLACIQLCNYKYNSQSLPSNSQFDIALQLSMSLASTTVYLTNTTAHTTPEKQHSEDTYYSNTDRLLFFNQYYQKDFLQKSNM